MDTGPASSPAGSSVGSNPDENRNLITPAHVDFAEPMLEAGETGQLIYTNENLPGENENLVAPAHVDFAEPMLETGETGPLMFTDEKLPYENQNLMPRTHVDFAEPIIHENEENVKNEEHLEENEFPIKDEDDIDSELTEDVYSLIYASSIRSPAMVFAFLIILFHYTIIFCVLFDLLSQSSGGNPLGIPPNVSTTVHITQGLALLLAVGIQNDILTAVMQLQQGYDERALKIAPGATRLKWFFSAIFQLIAGLGYLVTNFVLVMQSTAVLGMMMNFAALGFIMEIDNIFFFLAKAGFFTIRVEQEAQFVSELKLPTHRQKFRICQSVLFFGIYAALMAGYGVLVHQQLNGKFLCQSLYVQIADEFVPVYGTFSGIYHQTDDLINGRVAYRDGRTNQVLLAYCKEEKTWTASLYNDDPCEFWFIMSPETESYDITTTGDSAWFIGYVPNAADKNVKGTIQPAPPEHLQSCVMICNDCSDSESCNGNGQCSEKTNMCVCDEGRYGLNCEFSPPCSILHVDQRTSWFPWVHWSKGIKLSVANDDYELLRHENNTLVLLYDRPVYTAYNKDSDIWSIILFAGRRWVATNSWLAFEDDLDQFNATKAELIEVLDSYYHGNILKARVLFVSDAVDYGTPSNVFTPVGLGWYNVRTNSDEGGQEPLLVTLPYVDTVLLCGECDNWEKNGCYDGICNLTTKTCECDTGYIGALCEKFNGTDDQWNEDKFYARASDKPEDVVISFTPPSV